ncbi:hypothetical protein Tco_1032888 [Tanacetum coccineum]|uniref:DUF1985 domain-containing protein n=1 Tax=Tanacetum coccineum TaxID=301880 RepID=A0ABQ5GF74_9ASTR
MDLSNYEAPRVLVTCRSKLGLIKTIRDLIRGTPRRQIEVLDDENDVVPFTYLKFGVEYWADYNDEDEPIPFRRRVFSSSLDGKPIKGNTVLQVIKSKMFDELHEDDAVSLCCVGILQLVLLGVEDRRAVPDWILRLANDRDGWDKYPWGSRGILGIFLRTGQIRYYTLTQRHPRVGCLGVHNGRGDSLPVLFERLDTKIKIGSATIRRFMDGMTVGTMRQEKPYPFIVSQHYGLSDFSRFQSMQGGLSTFQLPTNTIYEVVQRFLPMMPSQSENPNWQPPIHAHQHDDVLFNPSIMNRPRREHHPSIYRKSPYTDLPPSTVLPKKRGGKSKNKGKKANVSPFNLGTLLMMRK